MDRHLRGSPLSPSGLPTTTHTTMTTNPWINRFAALALLFMMYAVGISVGRDQAMQAHYQHPDCHTNLKP
jgi:hypothetical protein